MGIFRNFAWWILQRSCYMFIQIKKIFIQNRTSPLHLKFMGERFYTCDDVELTAAEAEKYIDDESTVLLFRKKDNLIKIVRSKEHLYTPIEKCDFTFPIFYIDCNKYDISEYFVVGNLLDETFMKYITKHTLKDQEYSSILFLDDKMVTNLVSVITKIQLYKTEYTLL